MTSHSRAGVAWKDAIGSKAMPAPLDTTTRRRAFRPFSAIPAVLRFPVLITLVVVLLGSLELSGSSVSLNSESGGDDGLVAGRARRHRTDEWWVRTPLVARQATLGFPDYDEVGVGEHDMAVLSDLPTSGWETLVRPHTLPYQVFGIERAFAFEWWISFLALPALGLYALALQLGLRTITAALAAMLVALCPFVQWWTGSWTGTSIGYACLSGAALIAAARSRSLSWRLGFAALAGLLGACLVVVLYPPTVISMALVVGVAAAASIAPSFPPPGERRQWWLRLLVVLGVAGVAAAVLVVAFFVVHRGGIDAVSNSLYPGRRRNSAGTGDLGVLFGAPFDLIESTRSAVAVTVNGLNQSEAAAGLFTIFAVTAATFTDPTGVSWKPWRDRVVLLALLGVSFVLLAWYVLPIPDAVGRISFFDRVRPDRLLMPLAVTSALALGLFLDWRRRSGSKLHPFPLLTGTVAFAVPTVWAGAQLRIDGEVVPRWQMLLLAASVHDRRRSCTARHDGRALAPGCSARRECGDDQPIPAWPRPTARRPRGATRTRAASAAGYRRGAQLLGRGHPDAQRI